MTTRQRMAAAASLSPALYDLHVCAEGLALLSPAQLEEKDLRTLIAIDWAFESMFNTLTKNNED